MSSDEKEIPATFTCASCGNTFESGWSDQEAAAEAQENFPGIDVSDPDEAGVVCDDCYHRIMARARAEAPALIGTGWQVLRDAAAELGITQFELGRELFQHPADDSKCYRMASGPLVHVQPGCRCRPIRR